MAQNGRLVTLGELLGERAKTDQDEEILERVKILAQEHLPDGWTDWEVTTSSKEEVFGEKIDPNVLNKLLYALPTVDLARAFVPEADHLSEKGYREIRYKLLDWAFSRALILGPPSVANRIRGSAVRTEFFKHAVEALRPLLHTRSEADRILSGCLSETQETNRKRRSTSSSTARSEEPPARRRRLDPPSLTISQDIRIDALEKKMEGMFSLLLDKLEQREQYDSGSGREDEHSDSDEETASNASESFTWKAPDLNPCPELQVESMEQELEFRPTTKEADPLIPEPSDQLKREGIECQRLGTRGWNRIRYKEVEKHLHAASVFSALKVNTELGSLASQPSPWVIKQEGMLGTITHGLLLQRKVLAEGLNSVMKKCPSASAELRQLLAENSNIKSVSDHLLQFVCGTATAHRAETIEHRRKFFKTKDESLNDALNNIPPSSTHLFDESQLSSFLKDNGGRAAVFISPRASEKREATNSFRKPAQPTRNKGRKTTWRSRSSNQSASNYYPSSHQPSPRSPAAKKLRNFNQRRGRSGGDRKSRKSRGSY